MKIIFNAVLVLLAAALMGTHPEGVHAQQESTAEPNAYVGAEQCRKCHPKIYQGWKSTLHPYKFQDATPNTIVGDFTGNNILTVDGQVTRMSKKGDKYFITTKGPDGLEHTYRVHYLIGGFWKQLYVTEFPNGELHILPAMWIVEKQQWKKTKYWSKTVYQLSCTGCHNTGSQLNYDAAEHTYQTTWTDKGVSCEACHGPGKNHVALAETGNGDISASIVNPAGIPDPRRAAMVCGSCHNRGSSPDGTYGYPAGYRPGGQLNFLFDEKPKLHPNGDTRANRQQYIDWKKSGHAREGVLCWDCHYVHRTGEANKYQTKLPGNSLCRSCHQVENTGVHGIHSVNNCIGCHMPPTGKRAVKGDVHSHQFKVISPAISIQGGGVDKQPNSCNLCHYHSNDTPQNLLDILNKYHKTKTYKKQKTL